MKDNRKKHSIMNIGLDVVRGAGGLLAIGSVVITACGLLVLRYNATVLGIYSYLHHSIDDYAFTGAIFFYKSFLCLSASLFSSAIFWIVLGIALAYELIRGILLRISALTFFVSAREMLIRMISFKGVVWAFFIASTITMLYLITQSNLPSGGHDLLFTDFGSEEVTTEIKALVNASESTRTALFGEAVLYVTLAGLIFWVFCALQAKVEFEASSAEKNHLHTGLNSGSTGSRQSFMAKIRKVVLILIFMSGLLLLPLRYSELLHPNKFHQVNRLIITGKSLQSVSSKESSMSSCNWLLGENIDSYILYSSFSHQIWIVPKSDVSTLVLGPLRNIFDIATSVDSMQDSK